MARPEDAPSSNFPSATHSEASCSRAIAESESTVVLPIPRGGVLITRKNAMSSSGKIASRAYANASFTSARW